jgi:hypothetical protein
MSVFCLGSDEIDKHWDTFKDHLYRFERCGEINVEEARSDLLTARKQLWGYQDDQRILGVCLTRIAGETCEICGAVGSGSKEQILEMYAAIEKWAREIGCVRMKVAGRRGWLRVLEGFEQTGIIAEKQL